MQHTCLENKKIYLIVMMLFFILFMYTAILFLSGWVMVRKWFPGFPTLFALTSAFLIGVGIGIPITYVSSCLFSLITKDPMIWGMVTTAVLSSWFVVYSLKDKRIKLGTRNPAAAKALSGRQELRTRFSDIALILFSLSFSTWMMWKTFRGGVGGELFVGGNTVFDFGHVLGIIRSMSWGSNIPFTSPFFANTPFFYHLFFPFWIAILEYSGIPIVYAMNIPSALSFASFLIIIYYLPQILGKQGKLVGWIAVLLTITHSTLTFWHILGQKGLQVSFVRDIFRLSTYPFRGPFDGSVISIFTTLNSYVNQRHLAFASAYGLLLIILAFRVLGEKRLNIKTSILFGMMTGILFFWNMSVCFMTGLFILVLYLLQRNWKAGGVYSVSAVLVITVSILLIFSQWHDVISFIQLFYRSGLPGVMGTQVQWTAVQYFWENLGILPLVAFLGFLVGSKKMKQYFWITSALFISICLYALLGKRGFDQKFFSFSVIGVNIMAACGLGWLWKKGLSMRLLTIIVVFVLTISGLVDLMAIKNEFAYPLISKDMAPIITWIHKETPKDAVFVSYSDIIDPVVLSGRKNYFGFFGNVGSTDRSTVVKNIYLGDIKTAKNLNISYILIPAWEKNDFPYTVDIQYFQEHRMIVYQDSLFVVVGLSR